MSSIGDRQNIAAGKNLPKKIFSLLRGAALPLRPKSRSFRAVNRMKKPLGAIWLFPLFILLSSYAYATSKILTFLLYPNSVFVETGTLYGDGVQNALLDAFSDAMLPKQHIEHGFIKIQGKVWIAHAGCMPFTYKRHALF